MAAVAKARAFQLACRARAHATSLALAPTRSSTAYAPHPPPNTAQSYATHANSSSSSTSPPPRRAITVTSDDGRYNWSELSPSEKAARGTQQSVNFLLVAAGLTGTCLVSYFLYQELFAADSKTVQFNHAVNRVKADPSCRDLLGPSRKIVAYGEPTTSKWARARPLAYTTDVDRAGNTHFRMHFNMEGPKGRGVVNVHMTKAMDESKLDYTLLSLNVPGHEVVYLENRESQQGVKGKVGKMFGVQWR